MRVAELVRRGRRRGRAGKSLAARVRWDLRYARDGFSVAAAEAKGRALPEWYVDRPVEQPGDDFFLEAFADLSTCRPVGLAVGPIPWDRIVAYARWRSLGAALEATFVAVIRQMDDAFVEWSAEQSASGK